MEFTLPGTKITKMLVSLSQLVYIKIKKGEKKHTMKNFHEKVFIDELGLDVLELVKALTVESDKRVDEAVQELKELAQESNRNK